MVIESNLSLVYSIYTKKFGDVFPVIKNNENLPFILYNRKFSVSVDSYEKFFDGYKSYYYWKKFIVIISFIFSLVFIGLAAYVYFKFKDEMFDSLDNQNIKNEILVPENIDNEN